MDVEENLTSGSMEWLSKCHQGDAISTRSIMGRCSNCRKIFYTDNTVMMKQEDCCDCHYVKPHEDFYVYWCGTDTCTAYYTSHRYYGYRLYRCGCPTTKQYTYKNKNLNVKYKKENYHQNCVCDEYVSIEFHIHEYSNTSNHAIHFGIQTFHTKLKENTTYIEKIKIQSQKEASRRLISSSNEHPRSSMKHIRKIDKTVKRRLELNQNLSKPKDKQISRVISMKKEKAKPNLVVVTQNKELVIELVKTFFEHYNHRTTGKTKGAGCRDLSYTLSDGFYMVQFPDTVVSQPGMDIDMSNYFNRLSSFSSWPLDARVSAIRLAAAGFYYLLQGTLVKCFSCQLSVSDWSAEDVPLECHERLSPLCHFVQTKKGESASGDSLDSFAFPAPIEEPENTTFSGVGVTAQDQVKIDQLSAQFNAVVNVENTNEKNVARRSDDAQIDVDTPIGTPNVANTHRQENASFRGLPIYQPVDVIANESSENSSHAYPTDALSNQNMPNPSFVLQETEQNDNTNEIYFNQSEYEAFVNAKHPEYSSARSRLESFRSWTYHNIQHPERLVEAGFYFTDSTDVVRCYHCDIGLAEWAVEDDPWVEHARHSPQCTFLREKRGIAFIETVQQSWREIYTPKCPRFEDFHVRLLTFQGWPSDLDQSPREVASAGFYYTGEDDTVRCHYCDGGLRQWERGDNPWVEHARWFPFCKFVVKIKGLPFIEEVARTYNDVYVNNVQDPTESSATTYGTNGMNDLLESGTSVGETRRNALTTVASISILEMGYSQNALIIAVNKHLKETGNRDFTTDDLLSVIKETPQDDRETGSSKLSELDLQDIPRINAEELNNEELRQVNKQIKDKVFLCKMCKNKERNMVFIPCGHRETCEKCAEDIMICITCGDYINSRVKTFLS